MSLIEKIFGTHSERELKRIEPMVDRLRAAASDAGTIR